MSCVGDRWEAGSSVLVKRLDENVSNSTGDGGQVRWSNDWTYDEESRETRLKTWWIVTGI
jgi:hypothetical protein